MIDLSKPSGLPVFWNPSSERLVFGDGLSEVEPAIRRREEMTEVLFDPRAEGPKELYYMYRGVACQDDRESICRRGLRYDITVIKPGVLGNEYVKTAGHYHPQKPGCSFTYPEIYEVLHGRAHYLLQRPAAGEIDRLEAIVLVTAKPGDKVLIPPGFGHITINSGNELLIMSNWVSLEFTSDYEPYRLLGGGGYFELRGEGGSELIPNHRYRGVPSLHRSPAVSFARFNLITGLPIYRVYRHDPGSLDYLVNPENYEEEFAEYLKLILPGNELDSKDSEKGKKEVDPLK